MYNEDQTLETYENCPRWIVKLSNGEQKSHHHAYENSWQILKEYCNKNNLKIQKMYIGFRSNIIELPEDKTGYYFRRMNRAYFDGTNCDFFIVGYIHDEKIQASFYKVPEMLLDSQEERELNEDNLESII